MLTHIFFINFVSNNKQEEKQEEKTGKNLIVKFHAKKIRNNTHISHVKSNFKILAEVVGEFWIKCQDVEQVVPMDLVKVAIRQGTNVTRRFSDRRINARILAEYVVLAQNGHYDIILQDFDTPAGYKIQGSQHVSSMD